MSDFAIVNMGLLEQDLMEQFDVFDMRLPDTMQIDSRQKLGAFLALTIKYVDVDGLKKMQDEKDGLIATIEALREELRKKCE